MSKYTTFNKILELLDKETIQKNIQIHKSDKWSKGFTTWSHLVSMIFAQFLDVKSIRDLEIRFNAKKQIHKHILVKEVKRSTLSDANSNRDYKVFKDIACQLIAKQNSQISEMITLIDSSIIRISGRGSDWTNATKTRCGKGLKLHVQCTSNDSEIENASITGTNVNDITEVKNFNLNKGKIYVFDKGYFDYNWWYEIAKKKAYFVTRIKTNTAYRVIKNNKVTNPNVIKDEIIQLTNASPRGKKKNLLAFKPLRLIHVYDPKHNKIYKFISNLLSIDAEQIANYYKQRWGIELLFKWLKQNLKITTFLSENENAIKIQIYTAIIVYILISMLKKILKGSFTRTIDLLSWIKISIFSNYKPPTKNKKSSKKTIINCNFNNEI